MLRLSNSPFARRLVAIGFAVVALLLLAAKVVDVWSHWPTTERLALGRELFEHEWTPGDPLSGEGDGLGPVFNARSCVACHFQGGVGGGGPNDNNVQAFEAMPTRRRPEVHGGVVHKFATSAALQETREGVHELYPMIKGGRRIINGCSTVILPFDPVSFAEINTPALFGAGAMNDLPDFAIQAGGISRTLKEVSRQLGGDFSGTPTGRARILPDGRIGRFGWKAQFATLEEFVAAACAMELGLTNPLKAQPVALEHKPDDKAPMDMTRRQFRALVAFVRSLPPPKQILPDDPDARRMAHEGKQLFVEVGCAECHTPDLGQVKGIYTDLRLYKMVDDRSASYGRSQLEFPPPAEHPAPEEWKTPPLWGVADSAPYFHDGQSPTLLSAISRHSGHAQESRKKFQSLNSDQEQALIAFLKTLRAPRQK